MVKIIILVLWWHRSHSEKTIPCFFYILLFNNFYLYLHICFKVHVWHGLWLISSVKDFFSAFCSWKKKQRNNFDRYNGLERNSVLTLGYTALLYYSHSISLSHTHTHRNRHQIHSHIFSDDTQTPTVTLTIWKFSLYHTEKSPAPRVTGQKACSCRNFTSMCSCYYQRISCYIVFLPSCIQNQHHSVVYLRHGHILLSLHINSNCDYLFVMTCQR